MSLIITSLSKKITEDKLKERLAACMIFHYLLSNTNQGLGEKLLHRLTSDLL